MQNLSCKNEFDLHDNKTLFSYQPSHSLVVKKLQKDRKINFKTCLGREPQFETVWLTFSSSILSFVRNSFSVTTSFPVSRCFPCSMGRRDETSLGTKLVDLPKNSLIHSLKVNWIKTVSDPPVIIDHFIVPT